ncbi:MAG: amino acid adenylation domain-containing protein [Legionellaceae bacterium]|nr:amino acid adenylation domain-containing protein [Legionellaceae bacterium]
MLFEKQVDKTPDHIAVVYKNQKLTYLELNTFANQLARYILKTYQVSQKEILKPDTMVILLLDRSVDMLVAILAVLKAGGAYVPIDPKSPIERVNCILTDTNSLLLITKSHLISKWPESFLNHKMIIKLDTNPYEKELSENLPEYATSNDLAYVIYTSGTTGRPKGVMQPHKNVVRLFMATNKFFHFHDKDIWTLYHSYIFDFSVWEIWGALLYGGALIIPSDEDVMDMHYFYQLCMFHGVTVLNLTPSVFHTFTEQAIIKKSTELKLRYIIFGGEALRPAHLSRWWNFMGNEGYPSLINMYGITETTVHVTLKKLSMGQFNSSIIGKAIRDLTTYILDPNRNPVPIGTVGELYIGGAGLARGYLNQYELSKKHFVENVFATKWDKEHGHTRLYKTGDLVRKLENGDLEYIGRNDSQIKIHGYRIELGEIEQRLLMHPLIRQSIVLAHEKKTILQSSLYLVAYYVSDKMLDYSDLQNYLAKHLAHYMIPNVFIHMLSFPLTINGKLDQEALPKHHWQCPETSNINLTKLQND